MLAAEMPTLEPFVRQTCVLLTIYRRNGTPVGTPVNIAVDGDRAFVRTWDTTWKLKRIRNNPEVEVALPRFAVSLPARRSAPTLGYWTVMSQRTPVESSLANTGFCTASWFRWSIAYGATR